MHLWWVRGLILNMILPLLLSCCVFSFALENGVSFFGGIQHSPVDGCSAVSCNFGVLTGEDECTPFYSAILCRKCSCKCIVRTARGTTDFQMGKGGRQGCILSPCLFNLYAKKINFYQFSASFPSDAQQRGYYYPPYYESGIWSLG